MNVKSLFTASLTLFITVVSWTLSAQILDYNNKVEIILDDKTNVILFGSDKSPNEYYYLPTNLRLSKRPDGVPEFLFLKYTTDQRTDVGGVQGALMHFLMEWGLSPEQMANAQQKIKAIYQKMRRPGEPIVKGPVELLIEKDNSFRIVSAIASDKQLTRSFVSSGKAPLLPGGKVAAAMSFDKNGAQLMAATFEKARSITDLSIALDFKYKLLAPALEGYISINWSKFYESYKQKAHSYRWSRCTNCTVNGKKYSSYETSGYQEMNKFFEELRQQKIAEVNITSMNEDDPIAKEIVNHFMQSFVESVSEKISEEPQTEDLPDEADPNDQVPARFREAYGLNIESLRRKSQQGYTYINLKYRTTVTREIQLVGNMASWYNGVKDNKNCVAAINLNDPFYQHRDINFILDLESEQMFGKEANYVTVNVRKKRTTGNEFSDQLTIDREFLKEKGVRGTITYARGQDRNPDVYEYKAQWSLKGGKVYPENPIWQKGDWQGVSLAAPIKPRAIEFEANLDECKEAGIVRATLQLRYMKYGQEVESNIPITVTRGEPLVSQTIYTDRDQVGYAYRLIVTHKEKGKYVSDWDAKVNDDYIYATVPKKFEDTDEIFKGKFKKILDVVAETVDAAKVISPESRILTKFKDVLKILIN